MILSRVIVTTSGLASPEASICQRSNRHPKFAKGVSVTTTPASKVACAGLRCTMPEPLTGVDSK